MPNDVYRYIARVSDRRGRPLLVTEALATREEAIAAAFAARPEARTCSTERAYNGGTGDVWRPTGSDIRWHNREER